MNLDNIYNSSDPEAKRKFNSCIPTADSFKNNWLYVNAEHQITSLQLIPVHDPQRPLSYGIDSIGVLISSQLLEVELTPGLWTNVVNWDGSRPRADDKRRAYDESAIYLLSNQDVINADKAGAYDDPDYWTRTINQELDGFTYLRETHANLQTINLSMPSGISVSHLKPADVDKEQTLAIINSSMDSPQFRGRDPKVNNNFDWLFSQTMNKMYKDYSKNNNGFQIDAYLADRYQKGLEHKHNAIKTTINSLNASEGNTSLSGKSNENPSRKKAPVRLANGTIAKPIEKGQEASEAAKRDHVSGKKNIVSNEMNVSEADQKIKANATSYESKGPKAVSPNAETVHNEMNMMGSSNQEANNDQNAERDNSVQAENKKRLINAHKRENQRNDENQLGD